MNAAVRGQLLSLGLAALFLILSLPSSLSAASPAQAGAERQRQRYESSIQKLESGIEIRLGKLQIAGQQEFDLLGEIEKMDQELALQKVRLDVMQERRDSQKELLAAKLRELGAARTNYAKVGKHLQARLRAYYLTGRTGILNVAFSTRTLPELMLFNDAYKTLLDYDRQLIVRYRQSIDQLTLATQAHEKESALLNDFIANALQEQGKLDTLLVEKKDLLKRVKTEKVLHEQALKEMRKAEEDLQQTLAALEEEKVAAVQGFAQRKGTLPPPVGGTIIRRFGERQDDKVSTGIVIDAANGAEVTAIYDGRIIFSGYRRGYGNMVIIDHGMDYYSITARMEKIRSQSGNKVRAGDIIGFAGDIATLFDKGIYFEIRHATEPEDPLAWITTQGLTEEAPPP